ncbi:MFS transporter [soil metagenome]
MLRGSIVAPGVRQSKFFYGWAIVAALAITETVSYGILYYAFSIFIDPMRNQFGWSSSTITGAFSVALLISGLSAPLVGMWLDRHGPRLLMTAGSILGAMMIFAWSRVDSIFGYYAVWVGMGFAMAASFYEPAFATITRWFERDRRRAIVIVTLVAGFASTIFLPLTSWLEGRYGWRDALLVLAIILAAINILPHALILRRRPEDMGLHPDGDEISAAAPKTHLARGANGSALREALRHPAFWWITVSFFVETFATSAVALYMIPYLTDRGESAGFAATAVGLIGAAQVGSRLLTTLFGNRISSVTLTTIVFAMQSLAVVVLLQWQSRPGILTAVVLLGAGRGVVTLMKPNLIADFFGRANYGAISGSMSFFLTFSGALSPVITGFALAFWDGYDTVMWILAGLALLGAIGMLGLRGYRPHLLEVESHGSD